MTSSSTSRSTQIPQRPETELNRRRLLAGAGGGALAFALVGLGGMPAFAQDASPDAAAGTPAETPVTGGTLRVGVQGDPTTLDPHLTVLAAAGVVVGLAYEGLVEVDADLVPQPAIAARWGISADGLTYTFALRDNVVFHNGRALVADDVKYSLERVMNPDTGSPSQTYVGGIASIDVPEPATVVIALKAPDASFLAKLAYWGVSIVPREEVEKNGDLSQTMVGTGPFTFQEYVPNTSLAFGRHDAYREAGKPYVDGLEIQIVPTDTTRTTALVSNTVDIIEQVPHKDIELLRGQDGVQLAGDRATNLRWIVFNLRRPPFDQLAFRQAVAKSLDRQPMIDASVFGFGQPLAGLYPPEFWAGYQGEIPAQDVEGSRTMLASVTLPEGFRPKILAWAAYEFLRSAAVVVQEQLRQAGIEAELDAQENATYLENFFSGNFDIAVMGASGYMDPDEWIGQSLKTDGVNNAAGYANPELDALLAEGLAVTDQAQRAPVYQQIQQLIIDDAPWISLFTSNTYEGLRSNIRGFQHMLSGSFTSLRDTWIEQ